MENTSKTPDQSKVSLLIPVLVGNNSNDEGTIPGTVVLPYLHLLILGNSQYIPLSGAGKHSTMMRCCFHCQQSCFFDYLDDPLPDGAVIYEGNILFQYSKKEGMYTEVLENLTGNIFLATSRDHEILLSHRNITSHTSTESRRSNQNYV